MADLSEQISTRVKAPKRFPAPPGGHTMLHSARTTPNQPDWVRNRRQAWRTELLNGLNTGKYDLNALFPGGIPRMAYQFLQKAAGNGLIDKSKLTGITPLAKGASKTGFRDWKRGIMVELIKQLGTPAA